jgi:hypothetical protein
LFLRNKRLLAEVGKRVRGKGERANKNPFPFNLFPFPPLAKVTFARGLRQGAEGRGFDLFVSFTGDGTLPIGRFYPRFKRWN